VPALHALRDAFPKHRRLLATSAVFQPIVECIGGYEVVDVAGRARLPDIGRVALAINLHGPGPQSHRALLALHPRVLVAFRHDTMFDVDRAPRWQPNEHEVARWCRLLESAGIAADPSRLDIRVPCDELRLGGDDVTVIHPGAGAPARRWPADRFAELCHSERALGRRVLITGSKSDARLARRIAADGGLPREAALAGVLGLGDLAALVARVGRVVCNDTGIGHLATATGTPSVVLFGPTSPARSGPPPDRPQHIALWAGRFGNPHGVQCDPGLLELTVDDVLAALARLSERFDGAAHSLYRPHPSARPAPGLVPRTGLANAVDAAER
jgi:hypothetical protein